jgi:predicted metal-dependent hydrolase
MQETFLNFFVFAILIMILYMYLETRSYEVIYTKSKIDNKEYLVRNLKDKQQAADLLAKVRAKLIKIVDHVKVVNDKQLQQYASSEEKAKLAETKEAFERLASRFQPDNISESTPNNKYTSYSVNKGQKIVFCLRAKSKDESLVEENVIMFVAIHELGHIMTKSVGHTEEFWDSFRILLRVAIELKLYKNHDYGTAPVDYCGTKITDTPLKESLKNLTKDSDSPIEKEISSN